MKICPTFFAWVLLCLSTTQIPAVLADIKDWQDEMDRQAAVVKTVCDELVDTKYPNSDKPNAAQELSLKGCVADTFYYGLDGIPINYMQARLCALSSQLPIGPTSSVLMMVYANGQGVKRNYKLAKKAACEEQGAPAEIQSRIQHLLDMESGIKGTNPKIDICDDITSGAMMGYCSSIASNQIEQIRERELIQLSSKWTSEEKARFKDLLSKANTYFRARSEGEIDQSGTARVAMSVEEYTSLRNDFSKAIREFESGKLPSFTQKDFAIADRELNRVYRKLKKDRAENDWGTVKWEDIQRVQRIWLIYRDTWVGFGKLKYPNIPDYAWKTYLTTKRTKLLFEPGM